MTALTLSVLAILASHWALDRDWQGVGVVAVLAALVLMIWGAATMINSIAGVTP